MKKAELLSQLTSALPETVKKVMELALQFQATALLVGGPVRDFLLYGRFKNVDFDLELRYQSEQAFAQNHQNFLDSIARLVGQRPQVLEYQVNRFDLPQLSLELAPARQENFLPGKKGHSNFHAHFLFSAQSEQLDGPAFARRDFTINAMGLELSKINEGKAQWRLADPFNGQSDLAKKKLLSCSADFILDPVRLLRACRFASNLGFELSSALEKQLVEMDLSELSSYHFWSEFKKAHNQDGFLKLLNNINLPAERALPSPLPNFVTLLSLPSTWKSLPAHHPLYFPALLALAPRTEREKLILFFKSSPGQSEKNLQSWANFWANLEALSSARPSATLSFDNFKSWPQLPILQQAHQFARRQLDQLLQILKWPLPQIQTWPMPFLIANPPTQRPLDGLPNDQRSIHALYQIIFPDSKA